MEKQIQLISIDEVWDTLERQIIDELFKFGCFQAKKIDKDGKIIIGQILLKYLLRRITTTSIYFENTLDGIISTLNNYEYPFVIFYIDDSKISHSKEILEIIEYNEFINLLKELIRDFNQVLNFRIISCRFPYTIIKNLNMGEATKTHTELVLKTEIMLQHYQRKKLPMKRIQKVASKYFVELTELQQRKVMS